MSNINEAQLKQQYEKMNATQLNEEFMKIASIPNARTNIEALTKLTVLMPIFEERGISLPTASRAASSGGSNGGMPRSIDPVAGPGRSSHHRQHSRPQYAAPNENSVNIGSLVLGVIILIIGIGLTSTGAGVFYGAIIVGLVMIVKAFL